MRLKILLALTLTLNSAISISAEFESSWTLPKISYIAFSENKVGFVTDNTQKNFYRDLLTPDIYFIYNRKNNKIIQIDKVTFNLNFPKKYKLHKSDYDSSYDWTGMTNKGIKYKIKSLRCEGDWVIGKRKVIIENKSIALSKIGKCNSFNLLEVVNNKQLWLATVNIGGHGNYGAEGIIVQDISSSEVMARITGVHELVESIVQDPVSNNIWAITWKGIYEINPHFKIVSVNYYQHDFEPVSGNPIFSFANKNGIGESFSVISRLLHKNDRKKFYEVLKKLPKKDLDKFTLYDFFMCCSFYTSKYPKSLQSLKPFFVRAYNQNDNYHELWQQSICRLGGPDSKQYCVSKR